MLLPIIVPAKDEEGSIGAMLASTAGVLDREEIPFEVIVVDDGSRDRTARVVRDFSADDPRIRLTECFEPPKPPERH